MIAYKWTIKRLNQYYPLINFGIDSKKYRNCPRYKIGEIYNNPKDFQTLKSEGVGYHFWKKPDNSHKPFWLNYLNRINHKEYKFSILKVSIDKIDIIKKDKERIIANRFKILKEINI